MTDREQQLRDEAYRIWQSEGEPHGRDKEHWDEAERTLAPPGETSASDIPADAATPNAAAPTGEDHQTGGEAAPAPDEAPAAPAAASAGHALAESPDAGTPPPANKPAKSRQTRARTKPAR